MNKITELKRIAAELREMFPAGGMGLTVWDDRLEFTSYGPKTYSEATEFMRSLGVGVRNKRVYETFTSLYGEVDGVKISTLPDELPPTCRKVKKIERIPKTQVVETGEYFEVEREVIECGEESV